MKHRFLFSSGLPAEPLQAGRNGFRWTPVFCLLLILFSPCPVSADKEGRVLIINSDASVDRYRMAQEEFKNSISRPVEEVDLSREQGGTSRVGELMRDKRTALVYCIGSKAYLTAVGYETGKSIVFSSALNWLRLPTRKGIFGVSDELHSGMQLTLFRFLFPSLKKIGVLYSRQYTSQWYMETREAASKMGIEILGRPVSDGKLALAPLKGLLAGVDAIWLIPDPTVLSDRQDLFRLLAECEAHKKAVFSFHEAFARYGVALIASVDERTVGRQAAAMAVRLLGGKEIEEMVQPPAGSHITLNLRRIKEYGLQYREGTLSSVDSIVEY